MSYSCRPVRLSGWPVIASFTGFRVSAMLALCTQSTCSHDSCSFIVSDLRRSNSDCVDCVSCHCVPRRFLPIFMDLSDRLFRHTAPVSCDEVLWDVLCRFHSIVVCVVSVPTYSVFCALWGFYVIEDAINDILHLFGRSFIVFSCSVWRHRVINAVGNRLRPRLCSIGLYGAV